MQEDSSFWEEVSMDCLTEDMKKEIIKLHKLGVNIDEIGLFVGIKFGRRIKSLELVDFLFPTI